jgi:hypothetical protein
VKRLLHFVNEIDLKWFVAALVAIILAFALVFWLLAAEHALVFTYETELTPTFFDALYFSIVTISSLGYGDIRPIGWARFFVGLEVLIGLGFLGLMVAKISSVKQDYILRRMYTEAVDSKLEKYLRELEEQRKVYGITAKLLIDGDIDPELTTTFRGGTPGTSFFTMYRQLLSDMAELMVYEESNGALFGHVDDSRLDSLFDAIRGVLRKTVVMWERDRQATCDYILCANAEQLSDICDLAERLALLGKKRSHNRNIVSICEAVLELVDRMRAEILPNI